MIEEDKPNPDELLRAIQKQEREKELGHLKIFFGMSAGVGKTYAMLDEAQQLLKEGVIVVIGTINTHGRMETEELLQGIPIVPEKWVKYKDTVFEELDLETIIDMNPQLVLIDEIAHTNVPGSKHPKRWQDVIEILDAGIDVYGTLNVQHIESRKDIIEALTDIKIRETVPDIILERATTIELIDISPSELLQRIKEGKVYFEDQSKIAITNFFQEEKLMALREISLRLTAEKVDHDLHGILQGKGWKTRERIMVAISPSPFSEQLIRATRRLAFELDAPWVVVYVDSEGSLNDLDQARLNKHFNYARELGAEVITTQDLDITAALQRIAKQRDITRLVIGRPPKKRWNFWSIFQGSFIDRLENQNKHIDIIILRQEKITNIYQRSFPDIKFSSNWTAYALALGFCVAITLIGLLVTPLIGYKSVGYIFLLGILVLSFFVRRGPIFFAAVLSALCWFFLFIPPLFASTFSDPQDIALVIVYFFVAVLMGSLTSRMYEQEQFMQRREEKIEHLYDIERDIANATNVQQLRSNVCPRLENMFYGKFNILIKGQDNQLILDSQLPFLKAEKEKAAANWTFQNGKISGWTTDTLPSAEGLYFPIKYSKSVVGILAYQPERERPLSMEEMGYIQTVTHQLGGYLERYIFEEQSSRQDYARQIERLHKSIFSSLNASFKGPMDNLSKINEQLNQEDLQPPAHSLVNKMDQHIARIKFTIDNIIAMSELESGFIHFNRKKNPIKDLIDQSLAKVVTFMNHHPVDIKVPSQPAFLSYDSHLLQLALENLILNAFEYSPPSKPVSIIVQVFENNFWISILNEDSSIPEEEIPNIFNKFHRDPEKSKGLGIGLAITKSVVDIHQGRIEAKNREGGGMEFTLILPI